MAKRKEKGKVGATYLKYVADNEQAKEGKVLRTDHHAARRGDQRRLRGKVDRREAALGERLTVT